MAATDFGALTIAQKRLWAQEVWQAGRDQSFFFANGFIGNSESDTNKVISRVTKLSETERGMECVMQLVQDLQGDGVVGDNMLEGNEEQMINDAQVIRIDQLRHGVKSKGEMAEQATVLRFRKVGKEKLGFWLSDKLDELMFLTLSGRSYTLLTTGQTRAKSQLPSLRFAGDVVAPSPNRQHYAGSASSESSLTTNDKMSWATIVRAKARATTKRLRPIREGGRDYYCLVLHPLQMADLMLDPMYQNIVRTAEARGKDNPLFKGASVVVNGVVIMEHNKVFNTLGLAPGNKWGAGGLVEGAQAIFLGAQAGGLATIGEMFWKEASSTDYENRPGIATGRKIGMLKPQFVSLYDGGAREDFGTIAVKSAVTSQ